MTSRQLNKSIATGLALAVTFALTPQSVLAQVPVDDDGYPVEVVAENSTDYDYVAGDPALIILNDPELAELIGPVALYPDDLLAIVLPASTFPLQIVQAARFLEDFEDDNSLLPDESWDESIIALLNYPDVIFLMNDDIDWTWRLGEAVINQQTDVIASVETFRERAYIMGNLKSDEHQQITQDGGIIEIIPIEDDVIYVPYYDPELVVVEQSRPVYNYYPEPYPVYYYPYAYNHNFLSGYFWGVTTAYQIGWYDNNVRVHHPSYWGHPYYGRSYYSHYYRRPSVSVYNSYYVNGSRRSYNDRQRHGDDWRPRRNSGARQSDYHSRTRAYRDESRDQRRTSSDRARTYQTRLQADSGADNVTRVASTRSNTNRRQGQTYSAEHASATNQSSFTESRTTDDSRRRQSTGSATTTRTTTRRNSTQRAGGVVKEQRQTQVPPRQQRPATTSGSTERAQTRREASSQRRAGDSSTRRNTTNQSTQPQRREASSTARQRNSNSAQQREARSTEQSGASRTQNRSQSRAQQNTRPQQTSQRRSEQKPARSQQTNRSEKKQKAEKPARSQQSNRSEKKQKAEKPARQSGNKKKQRKKNRQ